MKKALVLFSGGLDSILATKLMQEQNIKPVCLCFESPFFGCEKSKKYVKQLGVSLKTIKLKAGYFRIIRKPKHGYGSGINPCIDCKIFMLKKAKAELKKFRCSFIVTGEVLNERPMSQTKNKLMLIEKEAGLRGKILRPLSARLLPETDAEKQGLVNRKKLLARYGRSRKLQITLAKKFHLNYPSPAGGCLLCEKALAAKLKDLFEYKKRITEKDIELLKLGRHFRYKNNKIVVGRDEQENKKLMKLVKNNFIFEVKDFPGPITILQSKGKTNEKTIKIAASLTVSHSDAKNRKNVLVKYGKRKFNKVLKAVSLSKAKIESLRIK